MKHLTEKEQRCLNRALGKSTELISRGTLMKTEKKAKKAAEKWASENHIIPPGTLPNQLKEAYIAGYMTEEKITPGTWKDNPGYQPKKSMGQRVDVITLDGGITTDVDTDYLDWESRAMMDSIIEWRLHDEY